MKKIRPASLRFLAAASVAFAFSAHAQIIVNGDFELPGTPFPGGNEMDPTGWSHLGDVFPGLVRNIVPAGALDLDAQSGSQYLYLSLAGGNTVTVFQSFNISVGGGYTLNWFDNSFAEPAPYEVAIVDASSTIVAGGSYSPGGPVGLIKPWTQQSIDTVLEPGTYQLQFIQGFSLGGVPAIDNVTLTAVPEASEFAMFAGLGLIGFAVWRKGRR